MRVFITGVLVLQSGLFVSASLGVERLLATSSPQELRHHLQNSNQVRVLKIRCLLDLKKSRPPVACYQWLHSLSSVSLKTRSELIHYLDEKCQQSVLFLKSPHKAALWLKTKGLSPFCLHKIQEALRVLIYQLRDQKPRHILQWHLPGEGF